MNRSTKTPRDTKRPSLDLDTELRALPVTTLRVVSISISECALALPNRVTGAQTEPLGNGTVLSHLLREDSLSAERLLGRLQKMSILTRAARCIAYHSSLSISKQFEGKNQSETTGCP